MSEIEAEMSLIAQMLVVTLVVPLCHLLNGAVLKLLRVAAAVPSL